MTPSDRGRPNAALSDAEIDKIIGDAARAYGVTATQIVRGDKTSSVVHARHEAMWRIGKVLGVAAETGRRFRRGHANVLNAWKRFEERNPEIVASEGSIFAERRAAA